MVPETHVDEIWVTITEQPVTAPNRTRCPECRRLMLAVLVPLQDREIELDICRPCQRLWLENQEKLSQTLDSLRHPQNAAAARGPKPPLIRMGRRPMDDQARMDYLEKLGRIRAFMERERRSKPYGSTLIALLVVLYVVWKVLNNR